LRLQYELRQSLLGNERSHRINDPQRSTSSCLQRPAT
jgi:hypothetical protein